MLIYECGLTEAKIFVLEDALLTQTAVAFQEKRGRLVAATRFEFERA